MPRAIRLLPVGTFNLPVTDTLILTHEERRSQRASVISTRGVAIELDLPASITLHTDDILALDSGALVDVVAAPEPLIEVRAELAMLARLAWALGDRHVPVQILANRVRLHRNADLLPLIASLGCKAVDIEAPFEPEGGAYAVAAHDHHPHGYAHNHDDHEHHDHHGHRHHEPHS
jgi:urease accessory protein